MKEATLDCLLMRFFPMHFTLFSLAIHAIDFSLSVWHIFWQYYSSNVSKRKRVMCLRACARARAYSIDSVDHRQHWCQLLRCRGAWRKKGSCIDRIGLIDPVVHFISVVRQQWQEFVTEARTTTGTALDPSMQKR